MNWYVGIFTVSIGIIAFSVCASAQDQSEPADEQPCFKVVLDLAEAVEKAQRENYLEAKMQECRSAGVVRKGIFLHPRNADDATVTYKVELPPAGADSRLFLVAWTAVNSDVADKTDHPWNGVRFIIRVNGEEIFKRDQMPGPWIPAIVPLDDAAGKTAQIQLATNAIDGHTSYDWSYYGQPQIVMVRHKPLGANGELDGLTGIIIAPVSAKHRTITIQPLDAAGNPLGEQKKIPLPPAEGSKWTAAEYDMSKIQGAMGARIADASSLPPEAIICPYSSDIELSGPFQGNVQVHAGRPLPITIALRNRGMGAWIPRGGEYRVSLDGETKTLDRFEIIHAGEEKTLRLLITPYGKGKKKLTVALKAAGLRPFKKDIIIHVDEPPAILDEERKKGSFCSVEGDFATIQTDTVRLVAARLDGERCRLWFQRADGGKWRTVAVQPFAAEVVLDEGGAAAHCVLKNVSFNKASREGRDILMISASGLSPGGIAMKINSYYSAPHANTFHALSRMEAPPGTKVMRFCGVSLRVSDRPGGENKLGALFPGLEYLGPNEPSSSARDAAPPVNNRLCPDRLKVTMPLMTVVTEDGLAALSWDASHKWDGTNVSPAAVFASPNFPEKADNHLMELYLPPPVEFGSENNRIADKACAVPQSGKLTLRYRILLREPTDVLAAVDDYLTRNGVPAPQKRPHDVQVTYRLSRLGFMKSCWDERAQKSSHCVGWGAGNAPHFALLLWLNSRLADKEEERRLSLERAELIIRNTLRDGGPAALNSGFGCHILWAIMPFYTGHIKEALENLARDADGIIAGQKPDGSWVFLPPTEAHATLGKAGDAVQGICANASFRLLRIARLTGYAKARDAGLKGLEYHNSRFRIPHGAQGWECPIYQPDVLGAAYAVAANLEAFRLTDRKEYLESAIYWARTGIPFHYVWQDPATPEWMLYAGIPVFGTTFYTHSWFGVPVQWCSLVYCYYVLHLAEYDRSFPWKQFVDGITVSGEWQQVGEDDPKLVGSYPDSLGKRMTVRHPAFINPEDIYLNRIALEGHDPEIQSAFLRATKFGDVIVNTCARLQDARIEQCALRARLGFWQGESSGTSVIGVPRPKSVSFAERAIPEADDLPARADGWTYVPASNSLLIRCRHEAQEPKELEIIW